MPCHANLPMLAPQRGFGQVRRPSSGASSVPSEEFGYKHGRIHDSGCKKMWLQRSADSVSCALMTGFVANNRLKKKKKNFFVPELAPSESEFEILSDSLAPSKSKETCRNTDDLPASTTFYLCRVIRVQHAVILKAHQIHLWRFALSSTEFSFSLC